MAQHLSFEWNDHNDLLVELQNFLSYDVMVDVTLACDGRKINAHKIILSACSPYFKNLFLENPCKHPIVILKDVKYDELKAIIQFMYHGKMSASADMLPSLLKTAQTLRVKGLDTFDNFDDEMTADDEHVINMNDDEHVINVNENDGVINVSDDEHEPYVPEIKQEALSEDNACVSLVPSQCEVPSTNQTHSVHQSLQDEQFYHDMMPIEDNLEDCADNLLPDDLQTNEESNHSFESHGPMDSEQPHCSKYHNSDLDLNIPEDAPSDSVLFVPEPNTQPVSSGKQKNKMKPKKNSVLRNVTKFSRFPECKTEDGQEEEPENFDDSNLRNMENPENTKSFIPKIKLSRNNADGRFQKTSSSIKNLKKKKLQSSYFSALKKNPGQPAVPHSEKEQSLHCNLCDYKTSMKYNLKKHHERIHLKKRPFTCIVCGHRGSERTAVRRHFFSKHEDEKQYKCPQCNLKFTVKEDVIKHLKSHKDRK